MKVIFCGFILMVLFISCNSKSDQEVDLDEVTKGSNKSIKSSFPDGDTLIPLKLSVFSKCFISKLNLNENYTVIDSAKSEFLQRFHPIQSEHWKNEEEKKWTNYFHWKFKDSIVAYTAFYNWLDQFDNGQSIQFGEQKKISKNSLLFLVQYRSVVKIESNSNINLEELLSKLTECGFGKTWDIVMFQPKAKMMNWLTKDAEGKLIPKKLENNLNE